MVFPSYCLLLFIAHLNGALSQEPMDMFWVSSECTTSDGKPQMCYPPFTSAVADRKVVSTNTCGEKSRQKYCVHMSSADMSSRCQYCDSRNLAESHFPEYITDKNPNNWWQSETMADNPLLHFKESVNLTVDLGTQFHVNYVYLQFRSPRPHAMVIYKRFDDKSDWTHWAYFSSNCYTYFGMNYHTVPVFTKPDDVICQEEYSTLQPLYDGEVIFSVINGRPNYDRFFEDAELQRWSTAKEIKIELRKMHTFGDERGAEKDTLLTYYFAIQKFTVGGRCLCHGHGNECRPSTGPGQRDRLVCVCSPSHHTAGDNCEQCSPDHRDVPWQPATPSNPNPCKPCKCNDNARLCEFDPDAYARTGSGSRCIGCGNNTEGVNCERCKTGYFPDPTLPTVCKPCACDPVGTLPGYSDCSTTGQCMCKPGVGGIRCDRCLDDYHGFSAGGCQPCNCSLAGGYENRAICDSQTGQCLCKQNVAGRQCSKCKLGHYGLMSNDPLGCKPCICSLHSSECALDTTALAIGTDTEVDLQALVQPDKVIINCPTDQRPCYACLQKDRLHFNIECNGTREGYLPCLCQQDPNQCQYCPSGWLAPQNDPRSEMCTCPPQYSGKSCESCAVGFRRDPPNGVVTDRCVTCTCNNHSTLCHPETGQCECQHNTGGLFCDRCADGYYGNALDTTNLAGACKPCPCPTGAKCEEVFWPDRTVKVVCIDCPDNRAGIRCDRCAENFYGDPNKGIPCVPCDCSNNVDPREFGNCDGATGECLKCIFGTTGRHCEKCLPGHRRNFKPSNETADGKQKFLPARGCSPCYCDAVGTLASYGSGEIGVCNPETGQCPCKPGVGGLKCEQCYPGFYGFNSGQGCKPCDCDAIGAMGEDCDDQTGRCRCRPNVSGRQCNQCLPGFFNLTSIHGCEACECHPFGSEGSQCDATGQCKCKPFAVGAKCDQCKENHYDLEAGCLSCPACYNLVQARVSKLLAMLESVFGPLRPEYKPDSQLSADDKDLYSEMKKLNDTIVTLYRDALQVGGTTSVISFDELTSAVQSFKVKVDAIKREIDELRFKPMPCSDAEVDRSLEQLDKTINEILPNLLEKDLRTMSENLKKSIGSYQHDVLLSKEADTLAELAARLRIQAESLKSAVENTGHLQANATNKISDAAVEVKRSKLLLMTTKQRGESIASKSSELAKRIEETNDQLQKTSNHVYQIKIGIAQLPSLNKEVRLLGGVATQWEDAKNTSKELHKRANSTAAELQSKMDRFRQLNGQLRETLQKRLAQAKQLEPQFNELKSLMDRVLRARELSSQALTTAQETAKQLKDFETVVAEMKSSVPQAMGKQKELEQRLEMVESLLRDLQDQAKDELNAARRLSNRTNELQSTISGIGKLITDGINHSEGNKTRLREMRSRHDVEIVQEVSQATAIIDELEAQSKKITEMVDSTQMDVKQMNENAANLLARMKKLRDQLTESASGGSTPVMNGEDAATRFNRLKSSVEQIRLTERLNLLRRLNESRTMEIRSMHVYLEEFRAHYDHLRVVNTLLPLRDVNCFYTGKEIEGDVLVYNPTRG